MLLLQILVSVKNLNFITIIQISQIVNLYRHNNIYRHNIIKRILPIIRKILKILFGDWEYYIID